MPRAIRRRRRAGGTLTSDQLHHLASGRTMLDVDHRRLGYGSEGYPFRDDAHRRRLWEENRDALMQGLPAGFDFAEGFTPAPGWRPAAFWDYEAPERPANRELQADALRRMGLLSAEEERAFAMLPELPRHAVYYDWRDPKSAWYASWEEHDEYYARLEAERLALRARILESDARGDTGPSAGATIQAAAADPARS